jgi:hypothetical protein
MSIVPDTFRTELTYSDLAALGPSTGENLGTQVWSCGGLYDPDITGSGHQPLGFDQWMAFYNHYVVLSCRIEVSGFVQGVSQSDYTLGTVMIGVIPTGSSTAVTTADLFYELPYGAVGVAGTAGGMKPDVITNHLHIPEWFGVTETEFIADDTHRGNSASNPSEDSFFEVGANRVAYSDASSIVCMTRTRLIYEVVFLERKELSQS